MRGAAGSPSPTSHSRHPLRSWLAPYNPHRWPTIQGTYTVLTNTLQPSAAPSPTPAAPENLQQLRTMPHSLCQPLTSPSPDNLVCSAQPPTVPIGPTSRTPHSPFATQRTTPVSPRQTPTPSCGPLCHCAALPIPHCILPANTYGGGAGGGRDASLMHSREPSPSQPHREGKATQT